MSESRAPTRFAIASGCWRRRRRCSAPAAPMQAWRRWRDTPASASARCIGISRPARRCSRRSIGARCEQLAELAEQLKNEAEPVEALRHWLRSNVEFVATKKGMSAALALAAHRPSELTAYSFDRLTKAVGALAGSRGRGRRDPRRYQPRGPPARAGRHVLHARPARLAERACCGCSTCSSMACVCNRKPVAAQPLLHVAAPASRQSEAASGRVRGKVN